MCERLHAAPLFPAESFLLDGLEVVGDVGPFDHLCPEDLAVECLQFLPGETAVSGLCVLVGVVVSVRAVGFLGWFSSRNVVLPVVACQVAVVEDVVVGTSLSW